MLEQMSVLKYGSTWESNENKKVLFTLHAEFFLTFWNFEKLKPLYTCKIFHWIELMSIRWVKDGLT